MNEMLPARADQTLAFLFRKHPVDVCGKTAGADAMIRDRIKAMAFAEQVYRGMQSLCARGAGSGERSAGVQGEKS